MRRFLKPFLLAMLALGLASSLTKFDSLAPCGAALPCPLVAVAKADHAMFGLYARGDMVRPLATIFGVVLPLLLLEASFLMVIGRLAGRVSVFAATVLTLMGATIFAAAAVAQYAHWQALFGSPALVSLWLSDPFTPRDAVILLASGVWTGCGLGLLAVALQKWRARAVLKMAAARHPSGA